MMLGISLLIFLVLIEYISIAWMPFDMLTIILVNYLFLIYYSIKILIPATYLNEDTGKTINQMILLKDRV
jgi:hypothetical protein